MISLLLNEFSLGLYQILQSTFYYSNKRYSMYVGKTKSTNCICTLTLQKITLCFNFIHNFTLAHNFRNKIRTMDPSRVRSASNVTVITRNLPRKLRVGKIENYP